MTETVLYAILSIIAVSATFFCGVGVGLLYHDWFCDTDEKKEGGE